MDRNFVPFDVIRPAIVALRKESVDRNSSQSPAKSVQCVALRKESVDRNSTYVTRLPRAQGRSPQGERG